MSALDLTIRFVGLVTTTFNRSYGKPYFNLVLVLSREFIVKSRVFWHLQVISKGIDSKI